ncbi:5-oxopent-3-ene-1-2-5-tricarboxylate decarboxylase [Penicillium daleae]|uniref:5-oxopent-3-ene-1-2-5-tricarboxylate decarboxylase n=1 Tax=Penicillium daleae TaxID=63821 RepID=A0AAD6G7Y9_9EURO|nr:5-oxopent-3-ene-1-2-5-tricarboxylate decarboxylase [Penicillium daleae]KAJ5465313.1 5-oxopent-3-ene-1-2-5-tricarboxylate decarboxylase [Penicillium daleae]
MTWSMLIRFADDANNIRFGEPKITEAKELSDLLAMGELYATEYVGDSPLLLSPGTQSFRVKELLGVLQPRDVPIIRCIGLNYMKHIFWRKVKEGGRAPPPYPSVFIKPSTSIAGFQEDIPIPKLAQDDQLDYEGELSIVIGKTGKDIPERDALDYVAGYCSSNDVSARKWQRDPAFAGGVPQWCFSKGFDKFAALGPMIVSPKVVGAADNLRLQTFVNGELRQDSNTNDLLFGVKRIISFVSQGTTLEAGTVIMTGTPAGVAMGMKVPKYLKDGDMVEVEIEHLGRTRNVMSFE